MEKTITVNDKTWTAGFSVRLPEFRGTDIGTFYPVLDTDLDTVIGFSSAEERTPDGYELSDKLQAFVPVPA